MTGIKNGLLDSNVIIYCSKKLLDFKDIAKKYDKIFLSAITYIETLGYNFPNSDEKKIIETVLNSFPIIQTDMEIISQVVVYKQFKKIKTPDAIILATAKKLGAELVTANEDDFKDIDPSVSIFVPTIILS